MSLADIYIKLYEEKCEERSKVLVALLQLSHHPDVFKSKEVREKLDKIIDIIFGTTNLVETGSKLVEQ